MFIEKSNPVAPCEEACPAGIDVPRYIRAILHNDFNLALAVNREKMPFPSVCAYICPAPCEKDCRMNAFGKPIAIRALKRLATEKGFVNRPKVEIKSTGKKVAIVGSGPAGLTASYFLAKRGHRVTVFEELAEPGGELRTEVLKNRLPKSILEKEISEIIYTGIDIVLLTKMSSMEDLLGQGYEAIFVSTGAITSPITSVPHEDIDNNGRIMIQPSKMSTSIKGLYACGAAASETYSVIDAISDGRRYAISVDRYLGGSGDISENLVAAGEEVEYAVPNLHLGRVKTSPVFTDEQAKDVLPREVTLAVEEGIDECKRCLRCDTPVHINQSICIGCGDCQTVCSGDIIRMSEETHKASVRYPQHCWTCYNCEITCPVAAITVSPIEKQRPLAWKIGQGYCGR